jgi:phosphonate transport system substrate-binding protein
MKRRVVLVSAGYASAIYAAPTKSVDDSKTLTLGISEAVSYKLAGKESDDRFNLLANDLAKALSVRIKIEKIPSYSQLAAGLQSQAYDLAFIHPAHHAIHGLKSGHYQLAAVSKAHLGYRANFLVHKNSSMTAPEDLAGKKIYLPDADSITAWMARAAFAELQKNMPQRPVFLPLRYQDAIRVAVEHKLGDAGATASASEVKEWLASGHRVLFATRSVPIKQFIVNVKHSSQTPLVRDFLLQQKDCKAMGVTDGFVEFDAAILAQHGVWLDQGAVTS